jgi:hypothetical protein
MVYLPLTVKYLEDPAPLDMRLAAVQVGSATAGYARFGQDIRMVTADADCYHVNIPLSGGTESAPARRNLSNPRGTGPRSVHLGDALNVEGGQHPGGHVGLRRGCDELHARGDHVPDVG